MKTAISLPDELFEAAEALAARLEVPRSRLYAIALEEFLARHDARRVSERLDAVYGSEPSAMPRALGVAQADAIRTTEW
jgi:metal-responsive CopG/Arc/MetJ family transcriptional regulator